MPCSGERGPLAFRSASSARACSSALLFSASTAWSDGPCRSYAWMRARQSRTSLSEVNAPLSKALLISAIVSAARQLAAALTDLRSAGASPAATMSVRTDRLVMPLDRLLGQARDPHPLLAKRPRELIDATVGLGQIGRS